MSIASDVDLSRTRRFIQFGGFEHRWPTEVLLSGAASASQLKAFAVSLVGLFDHLPRLYGPPVMTGADYKIRRLVADQLLSTVELPDRGPVRIGEGGHAALAAVLAGSLGADEAELEAAASNLRLVAAADELVATMFEPPAWVSMAAVAQTESDHSPQLRAMRDVLCDAYHVDPVNVTLFEAPALYPPTLSYGVESHLGTPFDEALFTYYRRRIHHEWQALWGVCFDIAGAA